MLVNLSKDELENIIYCLDGYLQGNDDEEISDDIVTICTKLESIASACTCKEDT